MKKQTPLFLFLMSLSLAVTVAGGQQPNLLKNPGFENWDGTAPASWQSTSSSVLENDGWKGTKSVVFANPGEDWKGVEQVIPVDRKKNPVLTVAGFVRIKDVVQGKNEWDMARIAVLFFDTKGVQVGGWPEVGRWKGTADWSYKEKSFEIPEGAATCKIAIQLGSCSGTMWADDITAIYGRPVRQNDPANMLLNGGLEYGSDTPESWDFYDDDPADFASPGNNSPRCFYISLKKSGYPMLNQTFELDGKTVKKVKVGADYKLKDVIQGKEEWEKARLNVEFFDAKKERINGWPVIGDAVGTVGDWQRWEQVIDVPPSTRSMTVSIGILNTSGEMWVDNLLCQALDANGASLKRKEKMKETRKDWHSFKPDLNQVPVWKDLNLSFLLDAPAGKHGFVKNSAGAAAFGDGTTMKFWGTDLVAGDAFPTHENAARVAERLASLGCNLVRLHHMDADWATPNIFGNNPDSTKELNAESLDRLDFLVNELVKRGIYIYMDLLVHRKPAKNDGIADWQDLPNGLKGLAHFDRPAIELQKDYAQKLLTHFNPYMKKKYVEEPAVVASEVINESSLFYIDRQSDLPERYKKELDGLFNAWLLKKYGSRDKLAQAWSKAGKLDLGNDEDPAKNTVRRAVNQVNWEDWTNNMYSSDGHGRWADTKRFYYEVQKAHYDEMVSFLRSLGYKGLLTGSNHWERFDADILSNVYDDIDRHTYYDHPDTSAGWEMADVKFRNSSVLKDAKNNVAEIASCRVKGYPFFVTEWNIPHNNEFRLAGPVMMAAYGCLQDWTGLLQFAWGSDRWSNKLSDLFDFSESPAVLSQWIAASLIFHKGMIRKADHVVVDKVGEDLVFDKPESAFRVVGQDLGLPLVCQVEKEFAVKGLSVLADPSALLKQFADPANKVYRSDTGELTWNLDKGYILLDSPFCQGVMGDASGTKFDFKDISLTPGTGFSSVILVSLDGKPLSSSSRMVLITAARDANTGMEYNSSRTAFESAGTSPVVLEPVKAQIVFKSRDSLAVRSSDDNGVFAASAGQTAKAGSAFTLSQATLFYEFTPGK